MSTAAVLSFRLSGSEPWYVTVPQMPEHAVVGCSPALQARAAAVHHAACDRRLRMDAIIGVPGPSVNLTAVSAGNNVNSAMPIYEYRCTKCQTRFSQQEG